MTRGVGTQSLKAQRMPRQVRHGEANPNAKLAVDAVVAIRAALSSGATLRTAAQANGTSITNAWLIKHGKTWVDAQ